MQEQKNEKEGRRHGVGPYQLRYYNISLNKFKCSLHLPINFFFHFFQDMSNFEQIKIAVVVHKAPFLTNLTRTNVNSGNNGKMLSVFEVTQLLVRPKRLVTTPSMSVRANSKKI